MTTTRDINSQQQYRDCSLFYRNNPLQKCYLKIVTQCFISASFKSLLFDLIDSSNSSPTQPTCNRHIPHSITVPANITFVPGEKKRYVNEQESYNEHKHMKHIY